MMKIFLLHVCLLTSSCIYGQNCNSFNSTKKSNDTVIIKANYLGEVMLPKKSDSFLLLLEKKGVLNSKDFNSSIQFKIQGCNQNYNLLKFDKGCLNCDNLMYNQKVLLTCIILPFNNLSKLKSEPPVIVIKVIKLD
ncbi:hypothetical protein I5M32_16520 [Pedobacter sp. SD-b]|uniref:Lipoprotein n=1 Tax=Pedobacter segetis TaxID=2793069 RepID=A0ABS1BPX5_9SPHI|nr:hypothetical protein [Pedobacter segetis]MBK0384566.1 hypothetical protein [Pedobacter segetis]